MNNRVEQDPRTISDFSSQWTKFPDNDGYFVSLKLFEDSLAGLLRLEDFVGAKALDLGSGTGRIIRWLVEAGVNHAYAVEPAATIDILKENTKNYSDKITYLNCPGNEIDLQQECDLAVSLGVVSYIPNPLPTFKAIHRALRPGGRFFVLVMAREGNEFYCNVVLPLRKITTRLSDSMLFALSGFLAAVSTVYAWACKVLPMPMHRYFTSVFAKMAWRERTMLIFDQLNPSYAHYYRADELRELFESAGYSEIEMVHRYGYSWAVVGTKR